jgi:outer membrane protein OmpA-like peptidoglycan-associated protein
MRKSNFPALMRNSRSKIATLLTASLTVGLAGFVATPASAAGPATVNVVVSCTADTDVTAAIGDTLAFSFGSDCSGLVASASTFFNWRSLGARGYLDNVAPAGATAGGGGWFISLTPSTTFSSEFTGNSGSAPITVGENIAQFTIDQNASTISWLNIKWLGAPQVLSATPVISTQPTGGTIAQGSALNLTVVATSPDSGTLTYAWKKNGTTIPGATNSSYSVQSSSVSDAGSYTVEVTNTHNQDTPVSVTSSAAVIAISVPSGTPTITTQPAGAALTEDDTMTLSVTATSPDNGTLTYVWKKNGQTISGATAATLTIANVAIADAGSYTVVVTNTRGSDTPVSVTSTVATVTVEAAEVETTSSPSARKKLKKYVPFASGTSVLGASAKLAIKAAVKKAGKRAKYKVTGYAGTLTGVDNALSKQLATNRANAVKTYLVKLGVKKSSIKVTAKVFKTSKLPKSKIVASY